MRFSSTPLPGAFVVDLEPIEDERGMFARSWSREDFNEAGLDGRLAACNVSYNAAAGIHAAKYAPRNFIRDVTSSYPGLE